MEHNAHVAEFYYHKAMHAEAHYMHGRIARLRKLYYMAALIYAQRAHDEQPSQWQAQHV